MSVRPFRDIKRKKTKIISVGKVKIGGDFPIAVQSMTNTLTTDIKATINQINKLCEAGADVVRVSCPDKESSLSLKEIIRNVEVPIVADVHFHYKRAIEAAESGAHCLRINPGNIGSKERVYEILKSAKDNNCSIRIGVNSGSLEKKILEKYKEPCPEAMVESALENIKILEDKNFFNFKISVKSSIGLGMLLMEGIGDTIRVSLSADPVEEVKVGFEILKSLNLRHKGINIISCPSCARQAFPVIETVKNLEKQLAHIKTPMTLSIIGCVVNGPGEAAQTQIGLTGGGQGTNMVYLSGISHHKVANKNVISHIVKLVEEKSAELEKK